MKDLLDKFENKRPEIVFEWKDSETEAEGWVVINSLRGGAAGGGTRMRVGLDKREVESLAAQGPDTGGVYLGPAFAGLGAPHWDQHARGIIVGLTRGTGRAHARRLRLREGVPR